MTRAAIAVLAIVLTFMGGVVMQHQFRLTELLSSMVEEAPGEFPYRDASDPALEQLLEQAHQERPAWLNERDDAEAWRVRLRTELRRRLSFPAGTERASAEYEILETEELGGGLTRQFVLFRSFDGTEIPAYLHVPESEVALPAVLVIPGHVAPHESGIEQTAGLDDSYQHASALRLAKAGFVTLTFELRGFGHLARPYNTEHRLIAHAAIVMGRSYKEVIMRDAGAATDLLISLEEVAPDRVGITGASYGGELAVYYAALDERLKAIVFQAFGGRTGFRPAARGDGRNHPHFCHVLPGLDSFVRLEEWVWLLAPRPVLGIRGATNGDFSESTRRAYGAGWSDGDRLKLEVLPGGHEYFVKPAIEFFQAHL